MVEIQSVILQIQSVILQIQSVILQIQSVILQIQSVSVQIQYVSVQIQSVILQIQNHFNGGFLNLLRFPVWSERGTSLHVAHMYYSYIALPLSLTTHIHMSSSRE